MPTVSLRRAAPPAPARPRPRLLELALLRKSVGDQIAGRHCCCHCRRTPLVGERVHFYEAAAGERMVCDLCRSRRKETPARTQLMLPAERDRTVKVRGPAARGVAGATG